MNGNGSNMTLLVDNLPGVVECPSFSIDGSRMIFTHDFSGFASTSGRQLDAHVVSMNIDGSDSVDVSENKPNGTNDLYPRFTPNGAQILFTHTSNVTGSSKEIWIMDLNGQNRTKLIAQGEMADWK